MAGLVGYAGKILRVDLTNERITEEKLDEATLRKYVGGTSLAAKYLYDEVPAGVGWSSPENRLIFAAGPLNGTRVAGSGTIAIATKGANTNMAAASQANGFFGAFLRSSGFDAVVVQGAADRWLYLSIHDGIAELKEAAHLVDSDTWTLGDKVAAELNTTPARVSVFGIGPAGEHLVKFAAIIGDKGHVAAHGGMGAVMGSKKLKCVVAARGSRTVEPKDREKLSETAKALAEVAKGNGQGEYRWGTIGAVGHKPPFLPVKNYTTNIYSISEEHQKKYTAQYIREKFAQEHHPCWACARYHCYIYKIPDGPHAGYETDEPEYESMAAWGPLNGITDSSESIWLAGENDHLGMDANEAGFVISLVMECYEKGILTKDACDGVEMTWGNSSAIRKMLDKIAHRDGIGDALAEGTMRAARLIGGDALQLAIHTMKGSSPRSHDHRIQWAELFDTCFSNTSSIESVGGFINVASHGLKPVTNPHNWEEVVAQNAALDGRRVFDDSLVVCRAASTDIALEIDALNAATGWDFNLAEAMAVGRRAVNLLRMFNFSHGLKKAMEAPSPRYGSAVVDGPMQGLSTAQDWDKIRDRYYELMGWDRETGRPLPETLKSLGLEYAIK